MNSYEYCSIPPAKEACSEQSHLKRRTHNQSNSGGEDKGGGEASPRRGTTGTHQNIKTPVLKFQIIVSNLGFITQIDGPIPGATNDTVICRRHPPRTGSKYLLGDKAYISNQRVVPPIKRNNRRFFAGQRHMYNKIHGHYRSRVEQIIRRVKVWGCINARWRSHGLGCWKNFRKFFLEKFPEIFPRKFIFIFPVGKISYSVCIVCMFFLSKGRAYKLLVWQHFQPVDKDGIPVDDNIDAVMAKCLFFQ